MNNKFLRNVLIKGLVLFLVVDLIFITINPALLGRPSLYNIIFTGRKRFPFGEESSKSYNLSLFNLDAMFASLGLAGTPKPSNEYRIIVIGDSSIWGTLLRPEETFSGQMNAAGVSLCGKKISVYNLGYPTISLTKDLLVLDYAMRYHPDLIIWSVTLEAFTIDNQLSSPIVANNASRVRSLITQYNLQLNPNDPVLVQPTLWDNTFIGQRRALADLFRLQMYGVLWSATGIDQTYPTDYQHTQRDFNTDVTFHNMYPPTLDVSKLAFTELEAGLRMVGKTPILLINEPVYISDGKNSDIRYNYFYPRWAFDQWRQMMEVHSKEAGWKYLDLWSIVPFGEFTNSAIHLTSTGESILVGQVKKYILEQSCP
jgi:hypothetical protein